MVLMNEKELLKIGEHASRWHWLNIFAEFFLEFLNLISDVILHAFGMKGRLMSRFSCCSKCVSSDDMSDSGIEFAKISESLRDPNDINTYTVDSASSAIQYIVDGNNAAEEAVSISSLESSQFENRTKRCPFKSRIPRLMRTCGDEPSPDFEETSPDSDSVGENIRRLIKMSPLDIIHEFNAYVRKNNRQILRQHLVNWFSKFSYFIHISHLRERRRSYTDKEKAIMDAIKTKRDELASKIYELQNPNSRFNPNSFQEFYEGLIALTMRNVLKAFSESNGDSGDNPRHGDEQCKEVDSKEQSRLLSRDKAELIANDQVHHTVENVTRNKTVDIGGGEIMHILTKEFITARKKGPGKSELDYTKIISKRVETKYRTGKNSAKLKLMYTDEHECSPNPNECYKCHNYSRRGPLSFEEVKALKYIKTHATTKTKIKGSDVKDQAQGVQQPKENTQHATRVVEEPDHASSCPKAESPYKGEEAENKTRQTRRTTSAKRRLKSVPPSMDRHQTRNNTGSKVTKSQNSTRQGKVNVNDVLSIDGPSPDVQSNSAEPNAEECTKSHVPDAREILLPDTQESGKNPPVPSIQSDETPAPLHFIDTDNELVTNEEPKEQVYQNIDATVDLSRNTVEPRYGDRPNKKKLQAEMQIREKIKTKGEANKHLKVKQKFEQYMEELPEEPTGFENSHGDGDGVFKEVNDGKCDLDEEADVKDIDVAVEEKPVEPAIVNAVEQPQTMDDREFKMVPEEILRKDSDKLKDLEEMYGMSEKKDKKKKKEKKNSRKKLTIPLTY